MPNKLNGVISMSGDLAAPGGLGIQTNIPIESRSLSVGLDLNGRYHLDQITQLVLSKIHTIKILTTLLG